MEEKLYAFWLCAMSGLSHRKQKLLLEYFGSPQEVFTASPSFFTKLTKLTDKDRIKIFSARNTETVIKEYQSMYNKGIYFIYQEEAEFPMKLIAIPDAPYGIFYRGNLPLEQVPSVAVVGARKASLEARELAGKFGRELAENGIQVISGMARGVDIAAQRGALEAAGGRTYAVLGTGADICYPSCHINEYMEMQKCGGVLSEFSPGTPSMPYHFPLRNRIISALSDGILVIEARKGSGSLITAEAGLEQGKEILVLPGSIVNPQYEGSNELLQNGAALVRNVRDILDSLGLFYDCDVLERKKKSTDMLETPEKIVYAILSLEPVHLSRIVEQTGMDTQKVMEILLSLQMKHQVQTMGNNYYAIKL